MIHKFNTIKKLMAGVILIFKKFDNFIDYVSDYMAVTLELVRLIIIAILIIFQL